MKKTISILLFISFAIGFADAQINVDSLENILNTQKIKHLSGKEQFSTYETLSYYYRYHSPEKSLTYAQEALVVSEREKNKLWISISYSSIGQSYMMKGEYDIAYDYYLKGLNIAIDEKIDHQEAYIYVALGSLYSRQARPITALDYYLKALSIYQKHEGIRDKMQVGMILTNIGGLYRGLEDVDHAIYYLEKAREIAEELDYNEIKSNIYYDLGDAYRQKKEYDKALDYALKSLDICRLLGNKKMVEAINLGSIALIYSEGFKNDNEAEKYALEGVNLARELNDPHILIGAWRVLSDIYLSLKRYMEAETACMNAWNIDSTNIDQTAYIAHNIGLVNMHLGNREKATYYLSKSVEISRSLSNKGFQNTLIDLSTKYETEKKELRIVTLEQEKQLYTWMAVLGVVAIILGSGTFFYRNRLNKQKIKQLEQEKQLVATQALLDGETAERSRLARDLHDGLGGLLSVLKLNLNEIDKTSLTKKDEEYYEKVSEILEESNKELRRIAHHMMPASLMKTGLNTSLSDFCHAIPGVTFQYQGKDIRLDERLEVTLYRCTYELINNAVKYADATKIDVQLLVEDNLISLSVYDNGIGFDPTSVTTGSGLENIRTRIATFNGKMYISSSENGTEIIIEIEQP